jgi:hypothetical protein
MIDVLTIAVDNAFTIEKLLQIFDIAGRRRLKSQRSGTVSPSIPSRLASFPSRTTYCYNE